MKKQSKVHSVGLDKRKSTLQTFNTPFRLTKRRKSKKYSLGAANNSHIAIKEMMIQKNHHRKEQGT